VIPEDLLPVIQTGRDNISAADRHRGPGLGTTPRPSGKYLAFLEALEDSIGKTFVTWLVASQDPGPSLLS
jgi:hypothetical protein